MKRSGRVEAEGPLVRIEFKVPVLLKTKVEQLAREQGDGDVSSWLRMLINREWREFKRRKA